MKHIHKCYKCNIYTMKEICPKCNSKTFLPKPAKYSPEDKNFKYRLKAKIEQYKKEGTWDEN